MTTPNAATYHYLKGECHLSLRKWKKAERTFIMRFASQVTVPMTANSNIEAAAFDALGQMYLFSRRP